MSQRKYDLEERLLQVAVEIIHIIECIFVASIWTAAKRR